MIIPDPDPDATLDPPRTLLASSDTAPGRRSADTVEVPPPETSVEGVIATFLDERHAGRNPSPVEYLQQYPQWLGELQEFFAAFGEVEGLAAIGKPLLMSRRSQASDVTRFESRVLPIARDDFADLNALGVVGDYELLEEVGRGGMGIVYRARQRKLHREVALKMVLATSLTDREHLQRFRAEALSAAALQHPGIVPIYDVGEHAGRPYFAMAFVAGPSLAQRLHTGPFTPHEASRIVSEVARAVAWAHDKQVIHRDIKPGNILLDPEGRAVLADFGLAKVIDQLSDLTLTGEILGTPNYMAPEQVQGHPRQTGPPADIYSLGAVLYCLLTGRPPFQSPSVTHTLDAVRHQEPVPLRQLDQRIPADLETIALKCLEKDPLRRYATASALADDLQRHLAGEPILARPATLMAKAQRLRRRNPLFAALSGASVLSLLALTLLSMLWAARYETISRTATQNELASKKSQRAARYALAQAKVHQAHTTRLSHRIGQRLDALARVREAQQLFADLAEEGFPVAASDYAALRDEAASALLLFDVETEYEPPYDKAATPSSIIADYSHERFVEWSGAESTLIFRSLRSGAELARVTPTNNALISHGEFSADGNWVTIVTNVNNHFEIWNVQSNEPQLAWQHPGCQVVSCGKVVPLIGVCVDGVTTDFLDRATGAKVAGPLEGKLPWGSPISPDGRHVALQRGEELCLLDLSSGNLLSHWATALPAVDWSADGQRLVAAREFSPVEVRDTSTGALVHAQTGLRGGAKAVIDSAQQLVLGKDWTPTTRVWDLHTGAPLLTFPFYGYSGVLSLVPTGGRVEVLGRRAESLESIRLSRGRMREFAPGAAARPVISQDGRLVAVTLAGRIGLYDVASGRLLTERGFDTSGNTIGFDPQDQALWVSSGWRRPSFAERWPWRRKHDSSGVEQIEFDAPERVLHASYGVDWCTNPDFSLLAVGGDSEQVYIFERDAASASPARELPSLATGQNAVRHASLSPDGCWVVAGSHVAGGVGVYERATGQRRQLVSSQGGVSKFSPDGQWLAVGQYDGSGTVWRVADWTKAYDVPGSAAVFSPDNQSLAVNDGDSGILLLEVSTGRKLVRLETADSTGALPGAFTPDGKSLLVQANDQLRLLCIDLAAIRRDLAALDLDWME